MVLGQGEGAAGGRWKPNTLHSWAGAQGALGENWEVQEAPEEDHLGESCSSTGSALLSPLPQLVTQRKRHFLKVLLSRMADPALHLYSKPLHCGHQSLWGHHSHTKAQPDLP